MSGAPQRDELPAQLTVGEQPSVGRLGEQSRVQVTGQRALGQRQGLPCVCVWGGGGDGGQRQLTRQTGEKRTAVD